MNTLITSCGFVKVSAALCLVFLWLTTLNISAQPVLHIIDGDTVDWGRTGPGELHHVVEITNKGTDTLHIGSVRPSCGCTTAPLDCSDLAPGDTAHMTVSIDMTHKSGRQRKSIAIFSDDPATPEFRLTLVADIIRDLVVEPHTFQTGLNVMVDSVIVKSVEIKNNTDEAITLKPPSIGAMERLELQLDMSEQYILAPGEAMKLTAHIRPTESGVGRATIHIPTSSRTMPELFISYHCIVQDTTHSEGAEEKVRQ